MNLDDTSRCPIGTECDACGHTEHLAVATFDTPIGVICGTLCTECENAVVLRNVGRILSVAAVIQLVLAHCEHLGINLDQMAAAREAEQSE